MHINTSEIGSTGKIISDISRILGQCGHQSVLCAPKIQNNIEGFLKKYQVCRPYEQGVYRRISYITGIPYGFAPLSTHKVKAIIKKEEPDIVHLHSVNGHVIDVYAILKYLKKHRLPVIVTNHAEFLYTGNCSHAGECNRWQIGCGSCPSPRQAVGSIIFDRTDTAWQKMKKAFSGFEKLAVANVSPWVTSRAETSPILSEYKNYTVVNGINTDVFNCIKSKNLYSPGAEKIFLHVSAHFSDSENDDKGGRFIIRLAEQFKNEHIRFVVAGTHNVKGNLPDNITLLGRISDQSQLADWYRRADLTVLTSKHETFGMAVAESLCCGTPVAGFCSGGSESVALAEYSEFVPFGDVTALENIIRSKWFCYKNEDSAAEISKAATMKYSDRRMALEYYELYRLLTKEN